MPRQCLSVSAFSVPLVNSAIKETIFYLTLNNEIIFTTSWVRDILSGDAMLPSHNTLWTGPYRRPFSTVEAIRPLPPNPAAGSECRRSPVSCKRRSTAPCVHPMTGFEPLPALYSQTLAAPPPSGCGARQTSCDKLPASPNGGLLVLVVSRQSGPMVSHSLPRPAKRPWQGHAALSVPPQSCSLRNTGSSPVAARHAAKFDTSVAGSEDGVSTNRRTKILELLLSRRRHQHISRDLAA